ncbi:CDP-alcohol phosphatidyltransferase family protein [Flaviaesturariibacter amylovorans]|uniref:CDP-alcohol phosphatidyltransferase family protein n=1 Tax=Flaviaesturariibacter amylovorans TaxID=1084520 RepID=A0ABP8HC05_9BACT
MKQIPNFFTLLNLLCGCIAIVLTLQTGETIATMDNEGLVRAMLPERMTWAALFLFAAAVVDFLDGFLARLLKASSAMGEQLDSLSDMVSFGAAPGMILWQFLRMSFAREEGGLDTTMWALLPAFLFTGAVAWRLAKFNISTTQKYSFEGVPSPAGGLMVASLPLVYWYGEEWVRDLLLNRWLLYGLIIALAYLMTSRHTFMAMKFRDFSFRNNLLKYVLLALSLVAIVWLNWTAVPVIFLLYIVLSFFSKEDDHIIVGDRPEREEPDITV